MNTIEPFLWVFAVGGFVCVISWLFGRKLILRSRWARAVFCFLAAATITPTMVKFLWSWSVVPAVAIASITFCGDKDWVYGFLFGMLPILAVASVAFWIWSINLRRRDHVF